MARKNAAGYMKAAVGLVLIFIIIGIVNVLSKKADIKDYGKYKAGIDSFKKLAPFTESQKDSVSATLAGFWQYDKAAADTNPAISDRIELKTNGIVWRVISYKYPTDAGDTAVLVNAYTSYLRPFASNIDNKSLITLDNHIIRQTFAGSDTCYSNPSPDSTWIIQRTKSGLETGGRVFTAYDTTDLAHFFPEGAVAMVDAITVNQCTGDHFSGGYRTLASQPSTSLQNQKEMQ